MAKCVTCFMLFSSVELLRVHHKSEFHILNLRLSLEGLKPLTEKKYQELSSLKAEQIKLDTEKNNISIHLPNASSKIDSQSNKVNNPPRTLNSNNSKNTHLDENSETFSPNQCLFDNSIFSSVEQCLEYMKNKFSFFIPDTEYLVDLEGLLICLAELISDYNICMYCRKRFSTEQGVKQHMIEKGHTTLPKKDDFFEIFGDFYDYLPSYNKLIESENLSTSKIDDLNIRSSNESLVIDDSNEWESINDSDEFEDIEGSSDDENSSERDHSKLLNYLEKHGLKKASITEEGYLKLSTGKIVSPRYLSYIFKQRASPFNIPSEIQPINGRSSKTSLSNNQFSYSDKLSVHQFRKIRKENRQKQLYLLKLSLNKNARQRGNFKYEGGHV